LVKIGQNWQIFKLFVAIFTFFRSWTHQCRDVHRTNTVKNEIFKTKSKKINFCQLLPILATFYELKVTFWQKLVEVALDVVHFSRNFFFEEFEKFLSVFRKIAKIFEKNRIKNLLHNLYFLTNSKTFWAWKSNHWSSFMSQKY
jgi:hypothetical protein